MAADGELCTRGRTELYSLILPGRFMIVSPLRSLHPFPAIGAKQARPPAGPSIKSNTAGTSRIKGHWGSWAGRRRNRAASGSRRCRGHNRGSTGPVRRDRRTTSPWVCEARLSATRVFRASSSRVRRPCRGNASSPCRRRRSSRPGRHRDSVSVSVAVTEADAAAGSPQLPELNGHRGASACLRSLQLACPQAAWADAIGPA